MRKAKILLVLAPGFEEMEAVAPIDILRRLGFEVAVAGLAGRRVAGAHGLEFGCDRVLDGCRAADFDAVVLPGGMPGAANLLASGSLRTLLGEFYAAGKLVCAICAAPMVLAAAGVLDNRRFTMYPGMDPGVPGLSPVSEMVVRDGNVITGRGPAAAPAFAFEIAAALGADADIPELRDGMLFA